MKLVDATALRAVLAEKDASCRMLASLTGALATMSPDKYQASSHGHINHLATGRAAKTQPRRAAAIERALSVAPGSLFADHVVNRPLDDAQQDVA